MAEPAETARALLEATEAAPKHHRAVGRTRTQSLSLPLNKSAQKGDGQCIAYDPLTHCGLCERPSGHVVTSSVVMELQIQCVQEFLLPRMRRALKDLKEREAEEAARVKSPQQEDTNRAGPLRRFSLFSQEIEEKWRGMKRRASQIEMQRRALEPDPRQRQSSHKSSYYSDARRYFEAEGYRVPKMQGVTMYYGSSSMLPHLAPGSKRISYGHIDQSRAKLEKHYRLTYAENARFLGTYGLHQFYDEGQARFKVGDQKGAKSAADDSPKKPDKGSPKKPDKGSPKKPDKDSEKAKPNSQPKPKPKPTAESEPEEPPPARGFRQSILSFFRCTRTRSPKRRGTEPAAATTDPDKPEKPKFSRAHSQKIDLELARWHDLDEEVHQRRRSQLELERSKSCRVLGHTKQTVDLHSNFPKIRPLTGDLPARIVLPSNASGGRGGGWQNATFNDLYQFPHAANSHLQHRMSHIHASGVSSAHNSPHSTDIATTAAIAAAQRSRPASADSFDFRRSLDAGTICAAMSGRGSQSWSPSPPVLNTLAESATAASSSSSGTTGAPVPIRLTARGKECESSRPEPLPAKRCSLSFESGNRVKCDGVVPSLPGNPVGYSQLD